jgi:hypothetical protein
LQRVKEFPYVVGITQFEGKQHDHISPFGNGVLLLIQINHQPDATIFQFIILIFVYSSTCFGSFPAHHQELNDRSGSLWFLPSYRGDSRAVFVVGPADAKVKPEAATAVIELLMMGGKTPETC